MFRNLNSLGGGGGRDREGEGGREREGEGRRGKEREGEGGAGSTKNLSRSSLLGNVNEIS